MFRAFHLFFSLSEEDKPSSFKDSRFFDERKEVSSSPRIEVYSSLNNVPRGRFHRRPRVIVNSFSKHVPKFEKKTDLSWNTRPRWVSWKTEGSYDRYVPHLPYWDHRRQRESRPSRCVKELPIIVEDSLPIFCLPSDILESISDGYECDSSSDDISSGYSSDEEDQP